MRVLIITDEEWNDIVYGNNVLTNWFSGLDAEFAQIYASPGFPNNEICNKYFQITDLEMVKSIIGIGKAGHFLEKDNIIETRLDVNQNLQRKGIYGFFKKLSLYIHTPIMILRDCIWLLGHYNKKDLKAFISEFNPDIIFCPRFVTPKMMRLETLVSRYSTAPIIAFTADDEVSLNQINYSPLFWIRRLWIHYWFKKHVKLYKHYLMFSKDQALEYNHEYHLPTSVLFKCGNFSTSFIKKEVGKPITMVYAGRLYCNRWKTLAIIGKTLKEVNHSEEKIRLLIYTPEDLTTKQKALLSPENHIYMMGSVSPKQLLDVYRNADIALHVESFDKKNVAVTRYSFSTKIIDLMNSTCAIMAICDENQAGFKYLKEQNAAICISKESEIADKINEILLNQDQISAFAYKAWLCGIKNHQRDNIQKEIYRLFKLYK